MPAKYPEEFRDDVVRVALNRDPEVTLAQIAKDFGIHVGTIAKKTKFSRSTVEKVLELYHHPRYITRDEWEATTNGSGRGKT